MCVYHLTKQQCGFSVIILNEATNIVNFTGFDGGQRQWFRMEIFDQQTGLLIANLSSLQPAFAVSGLDSERLLKIAVMAVNSKGVSDRVILEALTLKAAEKRMGKFSCNRLVLRSLPSAHVKFGVLISYYMILLVFTLQNQIDL